MGIGSHMKGSFFKSQLKLGNLVQEIDAMKNGNYVVKQKWIAKWRRICSLQLYQQMYNNNEKWLLIAKN